MYQLINRKENYLRKRKGEENSRKLFLELFIKEIIYQLDKKRKADIPFDRDKILAKMLDFRKKSELDNEFNRENSEEKSIEIRKSQIVPSPILPLKKSLPVLQRRFPPRKFMIRQAGIRAPMPKKTELAIVKAAPASPEKIIIFSMGKLNNFLFDHNIQMIECPGAGKQVLLYRGGIVQNTNLFLTNEEINELMKEISQKTKIPLISGVFKGALDNLIITAVVSEFIGTRFIIQKKETKAA